MESPLRRAVGVLVFARRRRQALETPHFPPLQKGSEQEAPAWDTHYKPLMIIFEKFTLYILPVLALGWKAATSASQRQVWDSPLSAPQGESRLFSSSPHLAGDPGTRLCADKPPSGWARCPPNPGVDFQLVGSEFIQKVHFRNCLIFPSTDPKGHPIIL